MFQDLNSLSDDSWKYKNLFNTINPNIKTESELGIVADSQQFTDISNNIALYQQYSDALFSKTSGALNTLPTDNSPLGNRYFYDTETPCNYNNNEVNKNIAVDGMGFSTSDISNVSLIYSAQGNLKMIQPEIIPSRIPYNSDINDSTCVSINLQKSNNPNDIGIGYVSVNDYNRLNNTAFQNNCKKTADSEPSEACLDEGFGGHGGHGGYGGHGDHGSVVVGHNRYHYGGYSNWIGYGVAGDGYNEFIPSYLWTYPWYKKNVIVEEEDEKENLERSTNLYLHQDIISTFFLGSITILGLYIVFRMIKKSRD